MAMPLSLESSYQQSATHQQKAPAEVGAVAGHQRMALII